MRREWKKNVSEFKLRESSSIVFGSWKFMEQGFQCHSIIAMQMLIVSETLSSFQICRTSLNSIFANESTGFLHNGVIYGFDGINAMSRVCSTFQSSLKELRWKETSNESLSFTGFKMKVKPISKLHEFFSSTTLTFITFKATMFLCRRRLLVGFDYISQSSRLFNASCFHYVTQKVSTFQSFLAFPPRNVTSWRNIQALASSGAECNWTAREQCDKAMQRENRSMIE